MSTDDRDRIARDMLKKIMEDHPEIADLLRNANHVKVRWHFIPMHSPSKKTVSFKKPSSITPLEPFCEVFDTDFGADIILELPGIDRSQIQVKQNETTLQFDAHNDIHTYTKVVSLTFVPIKIRGTTRNGICTLSAYRS